MLLSRSGLLVVVSCFACSTAHRPAPQAPQPEPRQPVEQRQAPPEKLSPEELPGLEAKEISPVVLEQYSAVGGCHTIEYSGRSQAAGSVTVDWVIDPDGSVRSAQVAMSSFENSQFHDCVLAVTRNLRFPEAPGTTEVSWRFKFSAPRNSPGNSQATLR